MTWEAARYLLGVAPLTCIHFLLVVLVGSTCWGWYLLVADCNVYRSGGGTLRCPKQKDVFSGGGTSYEKSNTFWKIAVIGVAENVYTLCLVGGGRPHLKAG